MRASRKNIEAHQRGLAAKIAKLEAHIAGPAAQLADAKRELGNLEGGLASGRARWDANREDRVYAAYLAANGKRGTIKRLAAEFGVSRRTVERCIRKANARSLEAAAEAVPAVAAPADPKGDAELATLELRYVALEERHADLARRSGRVVEALKRLTVELKRAAKRPPTGSDLFGQDDWRLSVAEDLLHIKRLAENKK